MQGLQMEGRGSSCTRLLNLQKTQGCNLSLSELVLLRIPCVQLSGGANWPPVPPRHLLLA